MVSSGILSLVHVLVCWGLVFGLGLGSTGAALSIAASYWLNVLILAVNFYFFNRQQAQNT